MYGTAHAQNWRIFSNGCNGLRFADIRLFCSFLMTFDIQRRIPEQIQMGLLSYLQEIRAHGDGYWGHFDIMGPTIITIAGRDCQRRGACLLAVYEYINPRQGAVRCGNGNPSRAFKSLTKI